MPGVMNVHVYIVLKASAEPELDLTSHVCAIAATHCLLMLLLSSPHASKPSHDGRACMTTSQSQCNVA
jgi:hypothetical protein